MSKSHTHHRICNILRTRALFAVNRELKKRGEVSQTYLHC